MSPGAPCIVIGGTRWPLALAAVGHIEAATGCSFVEARLRLQTAMRDGAVRARGPVHTAAAESIDPEFWRFAFPDEDGRAFNLETLVRLEWFEVSAEDVLAIWPDRQGPVIEGNLAGKVPLLSAGGGKPAKRGPKGKLTITTADAILADLRAGKVTRSYVDDFGQDNLARHYSVGSRATAMKAWRIALSEFAGVANSDN